MVVDEVERALGRGPECRLGVGELEVLGVAEPGLVREAVAHRLVGHAAESGAGQRIATREHGHVVTALDELLGDQMDDELGPAVGPRRDTLVRRRKLRDPH